MDDAAVHGIAEALTRLGPSLDQAVTARSMADTPYVPGTIASEAGALPERGLGIDATVEELVRAVQHGNSMNAPGFFGFITTGATTVGVAAQAAAAAAGSQRFFLHSFNALEWTGLRWLADLCAIPASAAGVFTSGGSSANLLALGAARQAAYERLGFDAAEDGLPPTAPRGRIYASARAHRTVHRAAAVLGLGRQGVRSISCDRAGHMDVGALADALAEDAATGVVPIAVVAVAGCTDTGSIDGIADVVTVARRHDAWVHVDGAYGLIAAASPALAPRFAGVDQADSWIVDPHKWLATGLGVSAVYVRDGAYLTRAFAEGHADYLEGSFSPTEGVPDSQFDALGGPWVDQSLEASAPCRGVLVWAVLLEIGRSGVCARVERHVGFAEMLAERARIDGELELMCEPDLSIVCFRYHPGAGRPTDLDALNERIRDRLRRETPYVPTSTVVGGAFALRPCFINPRTSAEDVTAFADAVVRIGREECDHRSPG